MKITEKALGPDHPSVSTTLNNLAGLLESQGKYEEAEPLYRRALKIYEKALGPDHPSVATTLNNLATLYKSQGKYEEAEPLYRRALKIIKEKLGENHPNYRTCMMNFLSMDLKTISNAAGISETYSKTGGDNKSKK